MPTSAIESLSATDLTAAVAIATVVVALVLQDLWERYVRVGRTPTRRPMFSSNIDP